MFKETYGPIAKTTEPLVLHKGSEASSNRKAKRKYQMPGKKTSKTASIDIDRRNAIDRSPERGIGITEKVQKKIDRRKLLQRLQDLNDKKDAKVQEYKDIYREIKRVFQI